MATPSVYEMSNKNGSDSVLTAAKGTYIIVKANEITKICRAIVVLSDTVFASIKEVGSGVNVKTNYIDDATQTIKTGAIITPYNNKKFEKVQLISGSVMLVL